MNAHNRCQTSCHQPLPEGEWTKQTTMSVGPKIDELKAKLGHIGSELKKKIDDFLRKHPSQFGK